MFDVSIVGLQLMDQISSLMNVYMPTNLVHTLRFLRLIRILRLARTVRIFRELRVVVSSIVSALQSLVWTLLILAMLVFASSVIFTQVVHDQLADQSANAERVKYW